MRVSDVETNTAGEVTGYSCPECGSALELCHDLEYEREHGPHQTEARFACVNCYEETDTPDEDPERTGERLYSVRVEIMWNSPDTGGTLCESEELVSFESERAARKYVNGLFQTEFNKAHKAEA